MQQCFSLCAVPATPRGRQAGRFNSAASVAREITKKGSEQPTVSPGSSGERLYDADEVVPRGVRAAVQMFEVRSTGSVCCDVVAQWLLQWHTHELCFPRRCILLVEVLPT